MRAILGCLFLAAGVAGEAPKPHKLFCFAAVQSNPEKTLEVVQRQLSHCDGYSFYSNFADPARKIEKATDRSTDLAKGTYGFLPQWGEGTANRALFTDVWNHIAKKEHGYDFYVKIDPDTFLRPTKLRQILSGYSSDRKVVLSDDMDNKPTGVLGSMYVLSKGALDTYAKQAQDCDKNIDEKFEDMYMEKCMKRHGVKIDHPNNGATKNIIEGKRGVSQFLLTKETAYWPELTGKDIENFAAGKNFCIKDYMQGTQLRMGLEKCFSPDVAAIHPLKSLEQMQLAEKLLGENAKPASFLEAIPVETPIEKKKKKKTKAGLKKTKTSKLSLRQKKVEAKQGSTDLTGSKLQQQKMNWAQAHPDEILTTLLNRVPMGGFTSG